MNPIARKAGAYLRKGLAARPLAALLLAAMAPAMHAEELRLLHADAGAVHSKLLAADTARGRHDIELTIEAHGRRHALRLAPNRALDEVAARTGGQAQAFAGHVEGYPDSWAALTRIGDRWSGIWYDGAEHYGVEAAADLADLRKDIAADAADQMVYRLRDVVWGDASLDDDTRPAPQENGERLVAEFGTADAAPVVLAPGRTATRRLAVAFVTDAAAARQDGASVEANLLARLNVINVLYTSQLGVEVTAASITQLDAQGADPLGDTTDADELLGNLSTWRTRHASQRGAALTHLFTGRDLDGRTIGLAYLDALCSRRFSASLSESRGPPGFAALVAAHEIAHVFGAPHDGDQARACAATPEQYLMAARINGSQQFSACSREQMAPAIETASCLVKIEGASSAAPAPPPQPVMPASEGGGGGALGELALGLLGLLAAARARRRAQMRANQSSR